MNPEDRDTLFTIAEVAVAFAGFASIVSVLAVRSGTDASHLDTARLRGMLFSSLSAVALCFVPSVILRLGVSPDQAWRVCGALLVLGSALPFFRSVADGRVARQAGVAPGLGITVTVLTLFVVPAALGVAGTLGFAEAPAFIAGVLLLVASSGIAFARLVLSFSTPSD